MNAKTKDILKIAVTGGAGSGKTFVCNRLKELGLTIISSDSLAREVVAPGAPAYQKILDRFGEKILLPNNRLDRNKLRQIIIKDDIAREDLGKYIHPEITKLVQLKIEQARQVGERLVLIEVPLLYELDIQNQFDFVVMISAERELRIERLMERDSVSRNEAEGLIDVQMPDEVKAKQADFVINNDGSIDQLTRAVDMFYQKYMQKYGKNFKSS